jgi:hypothetical protein
MFWAKFIFLDFLIGPTNYDNLDSEMAFVLYNIGIMFTSLANREARTDSESMKTACSYYQNAAWAFHTLPDRYVNHGQILRLLCISLTLPCIYKRVL